MAFYAHLIPGVIPIIVFLDPFVQFAPSFVTLRTIR